MTKFTSFSPKKYDDPKYNKKQFFYTNIRKHNSEICSLCGNSRKDHLKEECPAKEK